MPMKSQIRGSQLRCTTPKVDEPICAIDVGSGAPGLPDIDGSHLTGIAGKILAGVDFSGTLLNYPAVGSLAADEIQYVAQRLVVGTVYDRMGLFIDSGGTAGRTVQLGVYDQTTPSLDVVDPVTRVAQTDVEPTNLTQPGFVGFPLTDGAATPETYTPPATAIYWLAFTSSSNALKLAASVQFRENFLFRRTESGGGGLTTPAGALSNPASSMILVGLIAVGVTIPS